ncbi:MAG: hypothetical protein Q7K34_03645 [archaeon]|nr:hypothetical protein [archaeon]
MPKLTLQGKRLVGDFSDEEMKSLELPLDKEFEILKARKGIWVLVETTQVPKPVVRVDELEQKIIGYLKKKLPTDLVEGKFEKTLSKEELEKFRQMLAENRVEKFKTNPKYIKFIYRPKEQARQPFLFENSEKNPEDYTIEKNGFAVFKNEAQANRAGAELADRIKRGEIKGLRSFTGFFYAIDTSLLESACTKIITSMQKQKKATLAELSTDTRLTSTLAKICCLFLSEEGILLEKKTENYEFIE